MDDSGNTKPPTEEERQKVISLLRYLSEFVKLRIRVTRSVDDYAQDGLVVWYGKSPKRPVVPVLYGKAKLNPKREFGLN